MAKKPLDLERVEGMAQECWNRATTAFGTARIFETRAAKLRNYTRVLVFFDLAVPTVTGALIGTVVTDNQQTWLLWIAGILSAMQLAGTVWSLASRWDDNLAYSKEAARDNHRLSKEFQALVKERSEDFEVRFKLLEASNSAREASDYDQHISDEEKRWAMRAALMQFDRPCGICGQVPKTMKPSNCDSCGNF